MLVINVVWHEDQLEELEGLLVLTKRCQSLRTYSSCFSFDEEDKLIEVHVLMDLLFNNQQMLGHYHRSLKPVLSRQCEFQDHFSSF